MNFHYSLTCTTPWYVSFFLVITGTPLIPFEVYSCELKMISTNADCANGFFTEGDIFTSCLVSDFTGLNQLQASNKIVISISPNPDDLSIRCSSPLSSESVFQLYDYQGREILSEKLTVNFLTGNYSTEQLANGAYIWKISDKSGLMQSGKLVID